MKKSTHPKNWNDQLRENDKYQRGLAAMAGVEVPERWLNNLPDKKPRTPSLVPTEHQEQVRVIQWWAWHCTGYGLPPFSLFAIPNGGNRDAITGAMLKAEGVRSGIPDLMLAKPSKFYFGLFLEMKRLNTYATPDQKVVGAYLNGAAYRWVVCQGADSAIAEIKAYLS